MTASLDDKAIDPIRWAMLQRFGTGLQEPISVLYEVQALHHYRPLGKWQVGVIDPDGPPADYHEGFNGWIYANPGQNGFPEFAGIEISNSNDKAVHYLYPERAAAFFEPPAEPSNVKYPTLFTGLMPKLVQMMGSQGFLPVPFGNNFGRSTGLYKKSDEEYYIVDIGTAGAFAWPIVFNKYDFYQREAFEYKTEERITLATAEDLEAVYQNELGGKSPIHMRYGWKFSQSGHKASIIMQHQRGYPNPSDVNTLAYFELWTAHISITGSGGSISFSLDDEDYMYAPNFTSQLRMPDIRDGIEGCYMFTYETSTIGGAYPATGLCPVYAHYDEESLQVWHWEWDLNTESGTFDDDTRSGATAERPVRPCAAPGPTRITIQGRIGVVTHRTFTNSVDRGFVSSKTTTAMINKQSGSENQRTSYLSGLVNASSILLIGSCPGVLPYWWQFNESSEMHFHTRQYNFTETDAHALIIPLHHAECVFHYRWKQRFEDEFFNKVDGRGFTWLGTPTAHSSNTSPPAAPNDKIFADGTAADGLSGFSVATNPLEDVYIREEDYWCVIGGNVIELDAPGFESLAESIDLYNDEVPIYAFATHEAFVGTGEHIIDPYAVATINNSVYPSGPGEDNSHYGKRAFFGNQLNDRPWKTSS